MSAEYKFNKMYQNYYNSYLNEISIWNAVGCVLTIPNNEYPPLIVGYPPNVDTHTNAVAEERKRGGDFLKS